MMHKLVRVRQGVMLLLSVLLAACLALGLCFIAPVSAYADGEPAFTYIIGDTEVDYGEGDINAAYKTEDDGIHYYSAENGWAAAVQKAVETDSLVLVKLANNWTAFNAYGFGTDATAYSNGALCVPANADMALDLCGNVINRKVLTETEHGENIVIYGNLKIYDSNTDSVIRKFELDESEKYVFNPDLENGENVVSVECKGGLITGGYSLDNGAGISVMSGSLTLENVLVAGNYSKKSGGGVYVSEGAECVFTNSKTAYNNANNGGGIYLESNTAITLTNSSASNNKSVNYGGGIYVEGNAEVTVTASEIPYNSATNGGGLYLGYNTNLTITESDVSHNSATNGDGGALQAMGGSVVNISGSAISYNSASSCGGIYSAGTLVIENSIVSHNSALGMRGGIYASKLTLKDSEVSENTAGTLGGGVYFTDVTVIDNSQIINNTAGTSGGGVYGQGLATITNKSVISGNTAGRDGGGLYLVNNKCTITDSNIEQNSADDRGGGIYHESELVLTDVAVKGNIAQISGGAIYNASSELTVSGNSAVTANGAKVEGGGIYSTNTLYVSGEVNITGNMSGSNVNVAIKDEQPVAEDGILNNVYLANANKIVPYTADALLTGEAKIGVTVFDTSADSLVITSGYGDKYIKSSEVSDPTGWFVCDPVDIYEYTTVLNSDGEVRFIYLGENGGIEFKATYADNEAAEETVNGYELTFGYGEKVLTSLKLNGVDLLNNDDFTGPIYQVNSITGDPTAYKLTGEIGYGMDTVEIAFYVYVAPKALEDGFLSLDDSVNLTFDGTEKNPVVMTDEELLVLGADYTIEFSDNVNAGTCTAVITGAGNYSGSITTTFTITKDSSLSYTVSWEYLNGEEWTAVNANTAFTYDGTTHDGSVRAVLTISGKEYIEYVYAQGYAEDAANVSTSLYLVFAGTFAGNNVNSLVNAATYTVTIAGEGNVSVPASTRATVKVNPADLGISENSFADYQDAANGNRLWLLSFNGTTTTLRDSGTTYYDPDKADHVTVGNLNDAYARYNGSLLTLSLNGDYRLGERNLTYYLGIATGVTYSNNTSNGAKSAVTTVTTGVTLTFNDNYATRTITLTKTWYVVNINNSLRGALSRNEATLSGWTYGNDVNAEVLRPEHGNYAVYTVSVGGQAMETFALTFSGSNVAYYNVKLENGVNVPDTASPYGKTFVEYLGTLSAGNYVLTVYVPEYQVTAHHVHWWDDSSSNADDENTIYHSITSTYAFTVSAYSITNMGSDSNVQFSLSSYTVTYNGSINNAPEAVFTLNGKTLELGVDYELRLNRANVGTARLTVVGKGGLTGEYLFPGDITITKATNSWSETPNVIRWVYGTYEPSFNEIYATPHFIEEGSFVQFAISYDVNGEYLVKGLESFTSNNGLVNDDIAQILSELTAGTYYLISKVEASENYLELTQSPMSFQIAMATNTWAVTPNVIQWQYKGFNQLTNLLLAQPKIVSDDMARIFKITTDADGNSPVAGLSAFSTNDGVVSLEVAEILNNLTAGTYYLTVEVSGNINFTGLTSTVSFEVARATNMWTATPTVQTWVTGRYNEEENVISAEALFGTVQYVIYLAGDEENVIYDTANGINKLKEAKIGTYILSAYVSDGSANYTDLQSSMVTFEIFAPEGLPWWVTLIIVVGALGAVALVLFILHDKGVLQMLTGKVVIAMRTKATVDATIAAIRANKKAEEAKKSIAEAEARDAEEARKKEEEEAKAQAEEAPKAEKKPEAKKAKTANEKDVTSKEETPKDEQ